MLPVHKNIPTAIVIFGGTGNLAETKLLPSLYNLYLDDMLPLYLPLLDFHESPIRTQSTENTYVPH